MLEGHLAALPLSDLLILLQRQSGILEITTEYGNANLCIANGHLISIISKGMVYSPNQAVEALTPMMDLNGQFRFRAASLKVTGKTFPLEELSLRLAVAVDQMTLSLSVEMMSA